MTFCPHLQLSQSLTRCSTSSAHAFFFLFSFFLFSLHVGVDDILARCMTLTANWAKAWRSAGGAVTQSSRAWWGHLSHECLFSCFPFFFHPHLHVSLLCISLPLLYILNPPLSIFVSPSHYILYLPLYCRFLTTSKAQGSHNTQNQHLVNILYYWPYTYHQY